MQSCQQATAPVEKVEVTPLPKAKLELEELDFLAKQIALTFSNVELQSYLQTATISSNNIEQILDARTPPDEPVLVVNYCEHGGNHCKPIEEPNFAMYKPYNPYDRDDDPEDPPTKKDRTYYFEWIAFDDWTAYEPWGGGYPEFKLNFYVTQSASFTDYKFGDEYGYWKGYWYTFGVSYYHKYISNGGWNHRHRKLITIHKDNVGKTGYQYGAIHLIEQDGGVWPFDGSIKTSVEVPVGQGKIKVEFNIGKNDDVVGTNSYIKLWGDPIYKNRNQKPSKGGMTDGIGDAYFSVWWE